MRTILGVVLAVTPAALWFAWSASLVIAVMAVALAAAALLVLLTEEHERPAQEPAKLPEEFIDEVHRLFPLTYHHSAAGPARFRQAMNRMQELLRRNS